IRRMEHFWLWAENTMLPGVFGHKSDSGTIYRQNETSIDNSVASYFASPVVLRQLRVQKDVCDTLPMSAFTVSCNVPYGDHYNDVGSYDVRWQPLNATMKYDEHTPWTYKSITKSTWDIPFLGATGIAYSGGGYLAFLGSSYIEGKSMLEHLKSNKWLDLRSRAIFIEFANRNPVHNLLSHVVYLLEFHASNKMYATADIRTMYILDVEQLDVSAVLLILFGIIHVLLTMYLICDNVKKIYTQRKQFAHDFWNLWNLSLILISIICIGIFFTRFSNKSTALKELRNKSGIFQKVHNLFFWDELFVLFLGILSFMTIITFVRLLNISRRVSYFTKTLSLAWLDLRSFVVIFAIFFFTFVQLFYLMLGTSLEGYGSFTATMATLALSLLQKFNKDVSLNDNSSKERLCLVAFVVVQVWIFILILVSIINTSFATVRQQDIRSVETDAFDLMVERLKRWFNDMFSNIAQSGDSEIQGSTEERASDSKSGRTERVVEAMLNGLEKKVDRVCVLAQRIN
ncbi:polycystin-2-like, partial [Saccoglossus kowalevskii]|uniref:Polycystin-2-like n=1 Tax=Saccoglossus kowalevskii TaxID=10224 RepID=A0ABM0M675_SACKO